MDVAIRPIPRRARSWGKRLRLARHAVQLGFVLFIGYVVVQHVLTPETSGVVVPSAEAFCPLGGFESLYKWVATGGSYVAHTHASNLILALTLLVASLAVGSFFCGWVCPFGALQEAIGGFSHGVQRRFPGVDRAVRALRRRAAPLAILDRPLRLLKYLVLAWLLVGTALLGVLVFRDVDPWIALLTFVELELFGGTIVLGIVVLAAFFVDRPWCRYACPLGAIIGTVGHLSPVKIQREASACLACDVCTLRCPVGIEVHKVTRVSSTECISCLECVAACPTAGGLEVAIAFPGIRPPVTAQATDAAAVSGAA